MTVIQRLKVDGFRNLKDVDLFPSAGFNLITGANGSGKTSLLEAIHVLGVGKSFRTQRVDSLVNIEANDFVMYAELEPQSRAVGLQKSRQGKTTLRFQGQTQANWQEVASALPLQVINSDSFSLLDGGARFRRRFMDWAVFHVEHTYLFAWRGYLKCLAQRNALLKTLAQRSTPDTVQQLKIWEADLARFGDIVHSKRSQLISEFEPQLNTLLHHLLPGKSIQLAYKAGWDDETEGGLETSLFQNRGRDLRYGATQSGPHRADFAITQAGRNVTELFSRGQLKMLVCAVKLAMGELVRTRYKEAHRLYACAYLVDDLASELDSVNRSLVVDMLYHTGAQCFFTAIEPDHLPLVLDLSEDASGKFHVEHGKIEAVQ